MTMLEIQDLSVRYGSKTIVDHVSLSLEQGQWLMLIGPNGAGKSTLVNAISQGVSYTGSVFSEGTDLRILRSGQIARLLGVLSQNHAVSYSFTVGELVRLGRYAYAPGIFSRRSDEDERMVAQALEMTGMMPLVNQSVLTLSGGELQRAFLAQLFAQDPKILILDEPTNHLDLIYQKQTFELIQTWLQSHGGAVISVVHDLSLARAYGSHALLMDGGKAVASGTIAEVFRSENLDPAYRMDVRSWMQQMLRPWNENQAPSE